MYTACFTGHRKIGGSYYNPGYPSPHWAQLHAYLCAILPVLIQNDVLRFISGMAIGVDMLAAEVVLKLRASYPQISLIAAVPFPSQPKNWPQATRDHYSSILAQVDGVHVCSQDPYSVDKMHIRDRWMVDNSSYVISVWDGNAAGGTYYTTKYASNLGSRQIFRVNPIGPSGITGAWLTTAI